MVKCLPEFEYFTVLLKKRKFISKTRISKVTDYAALIITCSCAESTILLFMYIRIHIGFLFFSFLCARVWGRAVERVMRLVN